MKAIRSSRQLRVAWIVLMLLGLWTAAAWASETAPSSQVVYDTYLSRMIDYLKENYTRASWDLFMRWVNFLILVVVIVKYARAPVIGFLKGKRAETARAIELMDEEKRLAEEKIKEGRSKLKASQERLELIRDRIILEGKRKKEQMIADARQESHIMLASVRTKIDHQIRDAYRIIRVELVEAAAERALAKLPRIMTENDHERWVGLWMEEANR